MKSSERLERLISMVPWLIANNGASVTELANRFQYPEETLINDLTKVLFFVGPHPHTPGDLIEVNLGAGHSCTVFELSLELLVHFEAAEVGGFC